jgi:Ca2+:H+ antiporter
MSIGLWFTLRTHAAVIWNNEVDEKKMHGLNEAPHLSGSQQPFGGGPHGRLQRQPTHNGSSEAARGAEIRDSQLYKRILGQSLKQVGLSLRNEEGSRHNSASGPTVLGPNGSAQTPHMVPPKSSGGESARSDVHIPGFSEAQNTNLVREVAEMAATAATIAARDATRAPRKASASAHTPVHSAHKPSTIRTGAVHAENDEAVVAEALAAGGGGGDGGGGHDAPNWSRLKSSVILCGATVLYALIAEILVNTVDVVLEGVAIDEKFLGITLFALVPNTTEFLVSPSPILSPSIIFAEIDLF